MYLKDTFTTLRMDVVTDWMSHFHFNFHFTLSRTPGQTSPSLPRGQEDEIEVIRAAKEKGIKVTYEVARHHLN